MVLSLRPKEKYSLWDYIPWFDYEEGEGDSKSNYKNSDEDFSIPPTTLEKNDIEQKGSLTEEIFKQIDQQSIGKFFFSYKYFSSVFIF